MHVNFHITRVSMINNHMPILTHKHTWISPSHQKHRESRLETQSRSSRNHCDQNDWSLICSLSSSKPNTKKITTFNNKRGRSEHNSTLTSLSQPQDTITGFCEFGENLTQLTQSL